MSLRFRVFCQWLDVFKRAHEGDVRLRRVLERYGSMIAARRENEKWKQLVRNQLVSAQFRLNLQLPWHLTASHLFFHSDGRKHDAAPSDSHGDIPAGNLLQQATSADESSASAHQRNDPKAYSGARTPTGSTLGSDEYEEAYGCGG